MLRTSISLSVVIPVRDEEENVLALAKEIDAALVPTSWDWEVIWVDDHSTDKSPSLLLDLSAASHRHRYIKLLAGTGQSKALVAGFQAARADILATLDADGQNDPADIPRLLNHLLLTNADMVNGRRLRRRDPIVRKIFSAGGNLVRNFLTGERLNDVGCAMRVLHRRCIANLAVHERMYGMHRFIPSISRLNGCRRLEEIAVNHRPRQKGSSKYSVLSRLPHFLYDSAVITKLLWKLPRSPRTWVRPAKDRRRMAFAFDANADFRTRHQSPDSNENI